MCMSFVIVALGGNLFILLNKIFGTFAGPLGGLFTVAILMKSVRDQTVSIVETEYAVAIAVFCISTPLTENTVSIVCRRSFLDSWLQQP